MKPGWFLLWCASLPNTRSCRTKSRRPRRRSRQRCSASVRALFCDIAEWNGEPVGFAVWFLNFSTFSGRHGIYLEDIYVRPAYRGKGIGKALMAIWPGSASTTAGRG